MILYVTVERQQLLRMILYVTVERQQLLPAMLFHFEHFQFLVLLQLVCLQPEAVVSLFVFCVDALKLHAIFDTVSSL